jgi:hypothetical protein
MLLLSLRADHFVVWLDGEELDKVIGDPRFVVRLAPADRGQAPSSFRGRTLPPIRARGADLDAVIRRSRERYGHPRAEVEGKTGFLAA